MEKRKYLKVALISAAVTVFCQIIAFCIPGWVVCTMSTERYYYLRHSRVVLITRMFVNSALWYSTTCVHISGNYTSLHPISIGLNRNVQSQEGCTLMSYHDQMKLVSDRLDEDSYLHRIMHIQYGHMVQMELEATIALFACILGACVVYRQLMAGRTMDAVFDRPDRRPYLTIIVAFALSGILLAVPVIRFARENANLRKVLAMQSSAALLSSGAVGFPYGLTVAGVGVFTAFLTTIIFIRVVCQKEPRSFTGRIIMGGQGQQVQMVPLVTHPNMTVSAPPYGQQMYLSGNTDHQLPPTYSEHDPPPEYQEVSQSETKVPL